MLSEQLDKKSSVISHMKQEISVREEMVKSLQAKMISFSEAEAGAGVVMIAGCGGLVVRQKYETEGRSQDGATYCATFSRELSVCGASNNSVRGAH